MDDPTWFPQPLSVANAMVAHGRVELLAHPLSQKYLQMKWNSYGKYFHLANLLLYSVFLALVTYFSAQLMEMEDVREMNDVMVQEMLRRNHSHVNKTGTINLLGEVVKSKLSTPMMYMSAVFVLTYIVVNTLREVLQLYQQKWHYLLDPTNLVTWILHICTIIMIAPIFMGNHEELQLSCASITVFLSWFNLLLYLQR
uniref:Uncharacterized protein n=1 Tax=Timema poppense TaxID=170557 RepID=A0A7R9DVL5_TIMPO|nr:unnamed protein product [Timema poppensis]